MTTLRFYRGIAVPAASAEDVVSSIRTYGLNEGQGTRTVDHLWRLTSGVSIHKPEISLDDTRNADWRLAVCACGTLGGAEYYAWEHNRSRSNDTSVLIEFESHIDHVRIDGRDFLYTAFQMGDPEKARPILEEVFGESILKYADPAWDSPDQSKRIALCDLATMDPDVISAHYANRTIIGGRHHTVFENAFTVSFPVGPEAIIRVWTPVRREHRRTPSVTTRDIVPTEPSHMPVARRVEDPTPSVSIFDLWKYKYKE